MFNTALLTPANIAIIAVISLVAVYILHKFDEK